MFKKFIAGAIAGGLAISSVAASAAPMAFDADRLASPVGSTEAFDGEGNGIWIALGFATLAALLIFLIENNEDEVEDLPTSP